MHYDLASGTLYVGAFRLEIAPYTSIHNDFGSIKVQITKIMTSFRIATNPPAPACSHLRHLVAHAAIAIATPALLCGIALAQAPIRERSDTVSTIDAARRAADAAHNAAVGAQSRLIEAEARVRRATEAAGAARKEEQAARAEQAAAAEALAGAKISETQAQAGLTRALEQRK
jgi:hypothetical protein